MDFEKTLRKYEATIRSIACRLDGRYTVFSHDDLCQEAALDLWEKYRDKACESATDSFILQGCYFFMKNYIRKTHKKLDQRTSSLYEKENSERCLAEKLEIYETSQTRDIVDQRLVVEGLAAALNAREKKVLGWQMEGMPVREMAKLLGISHPMVIKIIKSIRGRCTKLLAQDL